MKKLKKIGVHAVAAIVLALLVLPIAASAAGGWTPVNPDGLPTADSANELIQIILKWVFGIVALISAVFIVVNAVFLIIKADDEEERKKKIKGITYSIVGLVVALLAYALVNAFGGSVTDLNKK